MWDEHENVFIALGFAGSDITNCLTHTMYAIALKAQLHDELYLPMAVIVRYKLICYSM